MGDDASRTASTMARSRHSTRVVPFLALAIKSVSLTRMTGTLMQTYLGRDAGQRVLGGRIVRGVADRIDAVIWFSDLRGFTRITDTAPEQVIPLLNDYADVDRLGDTRAWRRRAQADRRRHARDLHGRGPSARLQRGAIRRHRRAPGVAALNQRRVADDLPITDIYLGLHVGEVFYGNIGSRERLDFTVIGPAVNEASRIAAMCRSVDQPVLVSDAFANVGEPGWSADRMSFLEEATYPRCDSRVARMGRAEPHTRRASHGGS